MPVGRCDCRQILSRLFLGGQRSGALGLELEIDRAKRLEQPGQITWRCDCQAKFDSTSRNEESFRQIFFASESSQKWQEHDFFSNLQMVTNESSNERLRLFVAIPVPEPVRDAIAIAQRELQSFVPRLAIAWTRPEQFHLTLRFLGGVPAACLGDLKAAIGAVCADACALQLRASGIGFFPDARSPRVIWAGIQDAKKCVIDLQRQIEAAVQPFVAGRGPENFAGHATLGRMRDLKRSDAGKLAAHSQAIGDRVLGEWMAHEIEIVRSDLFPDGARHSPVAVFQFRASLEA